MFEGGGFDATISFLVQHPEGEADHLLVSNEAHLGPHHITELRKLYVTRIVSVKLEQNIN